MKCSRFHIVLAVLLLAAGRLQAQSQAEYDVKAVFLYNFSHYIDWKAEQPPAAFIIAVYGQSEIKAPLDTIAMQKRAKGLPIRIREWSEPADIGLCHILFVPDRHKKELPNILERTQDRPILVVTESNGMARAGACMNFILIRNKLKFEMNQAEIARAGLKVSSQLKKLAIMVDQ